MAAKTVSFEIILANASEGVIEEFTEFLDDFITTVKEMNPEVDCYIEDVGTYDGIIPTIEILGENEAPS